jgi:sulfur carrier protein
MTLTINGESRHFEHLPTLADLIDALGLNCDRVAVELNRNIVSRVDWPATPLSEGDRLEIVHFVGGGLESSNRAHPGEHRNTERDS